MQQFLDNLAIISLIFSAINIAITLYNWYNRRPRLEFYESRVHNVYIKPREEHEYYLNSECIAFFYIRIANLSELPCTISEFSLEVVGFPLTYQHGTTDILERYNVHEYYDEDGNLCSKYILGTDVIKLPYTIPPLGYVEGYAVFPFAPDYQGKDTWAELTARTSKKNFKTHGYIQPHIITGDEESRPL